MLSNMEVWIVMPLSKQEVRQPRQKNTFTLNESTKRSFIKKKKLTIINPKANAY